jgi:hypothetical protein
MKTHSSTLLHLLILLPTLLVPAAAAAASSCASIPPPLRLDCHPSPNATQDKCLQSNCCWSPSDVAGLPWCFYPPASGYFIASAPFWSRDGVTVRLRLKSPGPFPSQDINELIFSASFDSNTRLRIRITDANAARWEPPDIVREDSCGSSPCGATDPLLDVSFTADPFGFAVIRTDDGSTIFNSSAPDISQPFSTLIYSEQFISLSSSLPSSSRVYGLGEQVTFPPYQTGLISFGSISLRLFILFTPPLRSPP